MGSTGKENTNAKLGRSDSGIAIGPQNTKVCDEIGEVWGGHSVAGHYRGQRRAGGVNTVEDRALQQPFCVRRSLRALRAADSIRFSECFPGDVRWGDAAFRTAMSIKAVTARARNDRSRDRGSLVVEYRGDLTTGNKGTFQKDSLTALLFLSQPSAKHSTKQRRT